VSTYQNVIAHDNIKHYCNTIVAKYRLVSELIST